MDTMQRMSPGAVSRDACDRCHAMKTKCTRRANSRICQRCNRLGVSCDYSPPLKTGRPQGRRSSNVPRSRQQHCSQKQMPQAIGDIESEKDNTEDPALTLDPLFSLHNSPAVPLHIQPQDQWLQSEPQLFGFFPGAGQTVEGQTLSTLDNSIFDLLPRTEPVNEDGAPGGALSPKPLLTSELDHDAEEHDFHAYCTHGSVINFEAQLLDIQAGLLRLERDVREHEAQEMPARTRAPSTTDGEAHPLTSSPMAGLIERLYMTTQELAVIIERMYQPIEEPTCSLDPTLDALTPLSTMESDHPRAPITVVQQSATTALLVASCYARLVTSYNLLLKDLSSSYFSAARADISVFLTGRLKISMSPEISFGLHIHIISQVMHRVRKAMVAYSCCHWPLASEKCGIGGTWPSEDKTGVKPDEDTALAYILRAASTEIGLREKKLKSSLQAAGEDTALKGM